MYVCVPPTGRKLLIGVAPGSSLLAGERAERRGKGKGTGRKGRRDGTRVGKGTETKTRIGMETKGNGGKGRKEE